MFEILNIKLMEAKSSFNDALFLGQCDESLNIMALKAEEMGLKGVALVAFMVGKDKSTWISKMKVCGALKNNDANFLAIAYAKAGEMADTLQNSGTTNRIPLLGEFDFLGGLIEKTNSGYILVVFSGASGEEDTVIATVGL